MLTCTLIYLDLNYDAKVKYNLSNCGTLNDSCSLSTEMLIIIGKIDCSGLIILNNCFISFQHVQWLVFQV